MHTPPQTATLVPRTPLFFVLSWSPPMPHGKTIPCSLAAVALSCSIPSPLPISGSQRAKCSPCPKLDDVKLAATSCWQAEGKAWTSGSAGTGGFLGWRQAARASPGSARVRWGAQHPASCTIRWVAQAPCTPDAQQPFLTGIWDLGHGLPCFTYGKQWPQPCPWRTGSAFAHTHCPRGC